MLFVAFALTDVSPSEIHAQFFADRGKQMWWMMKNHFLCEEKSLLSAVVFSLVYSPVPLGRFLGTGAASLMRQVSF